MTRDKELLRLILLKAEAEMPNNHAHQWDQSDFPNHDIALVSEHAELLREGGFLKGKTVGFDDEVLLSGITWQGYELIDAIKSESVWAETKKVAGQAGGFSVEVLKDVAVTVIKHQIKKHTGMELE